MNPYQNPYDAVKADMQRLKEQQEREAQRVRNAIEADRKRVEEQQKADRAEKKRVEAQRKAVEEDRKRLQEKQKQNELFRATNTPLKTELGRTKQAPATESRSVARENFTNYSHLNNLDDVIKELNNLIGMQNIKEEVKTLINFLRIQKLRQARGLSVIPVSLHSVFCGAPGTGKTTVARLIGQIYKQLGILSKGHLIETDRSGLVAGYVGQTALQVDSLVESALDGVLFIDEAYMLKPPEARNDFGQEAIDTLLKRMEDYRHRLVVIVAGYTEEMTRFVDSNPGLKSRFNRYFYFEDYQPRELFDIYEKLCSQNHYYLGQPAKQKLLDTFIHLYSSRDKSFGNGRLVRNIFEKTVEKQANRLVQLPDISHEMMIAIAPEDIPSQL
jgi:SpoVK/Ycf46/Vps4 family AAA+-type ATPase